MFAWRNNMSAKKPNIVSSVPSVTTSGGAGQTPAWSNPDIVMSAPAGIAMVTPQSASFNAGNTTSIAAGQDINLLAQANAGYSVKSGISLFTYGKASNPKKPNQEVGIQLHAASGKVSSQSQSDKTQITADKTITVASTTDAVTIQAPKHVLLTAQGAYIKMSGGNIEVHAPGKVEFKATMKSWTGPKSSQPDPLTFNRSELEVKKFAVYPVSL
jgi:type VI secretion system secreted protein VgrG